MYSYTNQNKPVQYAIVFLFTFIELISSSIIAYLISVSFGASFFEDYDKTFIFSSVVSLFSTMPSLILIEHKNPIDLLNRILILKEYNSALEYKLANIAYGCIIGSWFGALVIPLDWDRWWQQWPLPCLFGALAGVFLGFLMSLNVGFKNIGKKKLHL